MLPILHDFWLPESVWQAYGKRMAGVWQKRAARAYIARFSRPGGVEALAAAGRAKPVAEDGARVEPAHALAGIGADRSSVRPGRAPVAVPSSKTARPLTQVPTMPRAVHLHPKVSFDIHAFSSRPLARLRPALMLTEAVEASLARGCAAS